MSLLLSSLVALALSASPSVPSPQGGELEAEVPKLLARVSGPGASVPGLSLALADASGVVWSHAYGLREAGTDRAADVTTVFAAASLSKPVVAYAVLRLVSQRMLALDTPLVEYAPLPDLAHDPRHRLLTARMVLSHTTGLPNWRPRGGRLDFQVDPGTRWGYSGEGFVLLAHVVETLTGSSLEDLAHALVFEPLGMKSATFRFRAGIENLALPHDEDGRPQAIQGEEVNAAASLACTAADYARFLSALLRGEGLTPELIADMRRPQTKTSPGVSWGLGMGLEEQPEGLALWQWGHNNGYRAFAWLSPARERAFVFFSNSDAGMLLMRDLLRLATGVERHPAVDHLHYESWDSPERAVRQALAAALQEGGVARVLETLETLRAAHPPEAFGENLLNGLGYALLYGEPPRLADALVLFRRNVELFPKAANPWDSLGEALRASGDPAAALAAYRRAVELDPGLGSSVGAVTELEAEVADSR